MARTRTTARVATETETTNMAAPQPEVARKVSKVQFWIPRAADDDVRQHRAQHQRDWHDIYKWGPWLVNSNGQHRSHTPVGEVQFHAGFYETDNPHVIRALLADPIAKCRKADIVLAGIFTVEELREMGHLGDSNEYQQVIDICRQAGIDPMSKTRKAVEMAQVALPPLPDFDRMTEELILRWALDDTPEGRVARGASVVVLQPGLSRQEMVNRIRAELTLRGDPRVRQ